MFKLFKKSLNEESKLNILKDLKKRKDQFFLYVKAQENEVIVSDCSSDEVLVNLKTENPQKVSLELKSFLEDNDFVVLKGA